MFPIGDDDSQRRSFPVVTYALIALNILVFLVELSGGNQFIEKWAFIPARFSADPFGQVATTFTAMFMHGSRFHLFGNMLFLWIFGDNVEDRFGHFQFLMFYLLVGIAATLAQFAMAPHSSVPNVGASGAIAGVIGAYILMFPQSRVAKKETAPGRLLGPVPNASSSDSSVLTSLGKTRTANCHCAEPYQAAAIVQVTKEKPRHDGGTTGASGSVWGGTCDGEENPSPTAVHLPVCLAQHKLI